MNLKQEMNIYLDLFTGAAGKLSFAEYNGEAFYWNAWLLINQNLQDSEQTLPMLESLDPESVSQKLDEVMKTLYHDDVYTLDDFSRYQAVWTAETVALGRKWISIKKLKLIKKILKDKTNITIKTWDMLVFYVGSVPTIVSSFTMLDMQTSLLPDDPSVASAHVESKFKDRTTDAVAEEISTDEVESEAEDKSIADIVEGNENQDD